MKDCPKADVLTQHDLDPEGGIEDAMRTIRGAPFAIDDQAGLARSIRSHCGSEVLAPALPQSKEPKPGDLTRTPGGKSEASAAVAFSKSGER